MGYLNLEKNIIVSIFVISKINLLLESNQKILTNYLICICINLYLVKFCNHIYNNYIKSPNIEKYNYYLDINDKKTEFVEEFEGIGYLDLLKENNEKTILKEKETNEKSIPEEKETNEKSIPKEKETKINFNNIDLMKSKILKCNIVNKDNKNISKAVKYRKILIDIWKSENNKIDIINKNKLFKFLDVDETERTGFNYCKEIDLWFRNNSANISFKQILINIKKNDYKIDISIKLNNDRIINYNN